MKRWREEAILQTVADLLAEQGCQRFTMEDVAKRVGIAKGSLYLHTNARSRLVAQVLDRWLKEVPTPANASHIPMTQRGTALLKAILGVGKPEDDRATGRFPCCLHMSPCPQGWQDRWGELSRAYELSGPAPALDTEPGLELLGEAIQALAATPTVQGLLQEGQTERAEAVIRRFVVSYQGAMQTESAP